MKTSLKAKLVRTTMLTLSVVGLVTLSVVALLQWRTAQANLKEIESHIRESIESKGRILVANHSVALQGLLEDNAFGAVKSLIVKTLADDTDLVYGLVLDADMRPWSYETTASAAKKAAAAKDDEAGATGSAAADEEAWKSLGVDAAFIKTESGRRVVRRDGVDVIEFSAKIVVEDELLGTLRYGVSTARMVATVEAAQADSMTTLIRTLAILGGVGLVSILLGLGMTKRQAATITGPLTDLTAAAQQIASGDRSVRVSISSGDELERLGETFNQMVNDLNASYEQVAEMNQSLERKVEERTQDLKQKTDDVVNMMANIRQGIFTIVPGQTVHSEYSAHLATILETEQIAGEPFTRLLFTDSSVGSGDLDAIETTMDICLGQDAMMFDWNAHLLPTEFEKSINGTFKILEADWNALSNEEGELTGIMVTLRDVTELKRLQREGAQQERQLKLVGELLAVKPKDFELFITTSQGFLDRNAELLQSTPERDEAVLQELFRNMHTIKGNARIYGFSFLNDLVHEAEEAYSILRSDPEAAWDVEALMAQLGVVAAAIGEYEEVSEAKLGSRGGGDEGDSALLEQIRALVTEAKAKPGGSLGLLKKVEAAFGAANHQTIEQVLSAAVRSLDVVAKELEKPVPKVVVKADSLRVPPQIGTVLQNVFVHVLRNAVDHGIEGPDERLAAGKPAQGTITLEGKQLADTLVFNVYDDGRGLNLLGLHRTYVAQQVVDSGQMPTDEVLKELIFQSGVSTKDAVTDVSGRGVGMDAIRSFLKEQGGGAELEFRGPRADGHRPFELVLTCRAS